MNFRGSPNALLCSVAVRAFAVSWKDVNAVFLCKKQGSPQLLSAQKEMGHITLPPAIKRTQRRGREEGRERLGERGRNVKRHESKKGN